MLLKAKEADLKAARAAGTASSAHQEELSAAHAACADAEAALDAVRITSYLTSRTWRCHGNHRCIFLHGPIMMMRPQSSEGFTPASMSF